MTEPRPATLHLPGRGTLPATVAGPDDGPVVLLLHGFPQDRTAWDGVVGPLAARGLRVVAPDQRGYAPTLRPSGRRAYATDELTADVLAMLDGLGAERAHVAGHDWGGLLAWVLAARHPERLHTATSVSTPHPAALRDSLWRSAQALRSAYLPLFRAPLLPEALLLAAGGAPLRLALERTGLPPERARRYVAAMRRPGALTAALAWYRAASPGLAALGPALPPTLLVWGEGDAALGRTAAEATGAHVVGPYRFEVLAGAGHWVPEVAADRLVPLLAAHLAAAPSAPAP